MIAGLVTGVTSERVFVLPLDLRADSAGQSLAEEAEQFGLVGGDRQDGVTGYGVDLGGFPLLLDDTRGDAALDATLDLLRAELPRVKQKHRVDTPGPGGTPRGCGRRRRPGQDEIEIEPLGVAGIQNTLALQVPLDIDGAAPQRRGAEDAVDTRCGRCPLEFDSEDARGDRLTEMPRGH